MSKKRIWLGALSTLGLGMYSFSASADFYAGALVSYSNTEYKHSSQPSVVEGNPFLLQAQFGYFFNDYIATEIRYGTSVQRDNDLAVDSLASGFLKLNMPVAERIALYGLAGYSNVQLDKKNSGASDDQGFSFGLGMHYALDKNSAVVFEFVDVSSEEQARLNTLTVGFQHRF